jgi:hypothetical protein
MQLFLIFSNLYSLSSSFGTISIGQQYCHCPPVQYPDIITIFSSKIKLILHPDIEGYVGDPLGAGSVIPSKEGYQE